MSAYNFGLESFNQRVLEVMRKGTAVETIESNIDSCLEARLPFHLFCILGFPGETESETEKTIEFARWAVTRSTILNQASHSSWGASRFVLDRHSPVGQNPSAFGIAVVPPADEEDLAVTLEYRLATAPAAPFPRSDDGRPLAESPSTSSSSRFVELSVADGAQGPPPPTVLGRRLRPKPVFPAEACTPSGSPGGISFPPTESQ